MPVLQLSRSQPHLEITPQLIPSVGSHCLRQQGYAKCAILTVQVIAKVPLLQRLESLKSLTFQRTIGNFSVPLLAEAMAANRRDRRVTLATSYPAQRRRQGVVPLLTKLPRLFYVQDTTGLYPSVAYKIVSGVGQGATLLGQPFYRAIQRNCHYSYRALRPISS